ncbi:MAG: hypothetical protein V3R87_01825 [Dehalococcoidia bacterium]
MNIKDITLGKLAVASLMFNSLTTYNNSLVNFRFATGDRIDLTIQEHREAMMKWLNDWGCRHLSKGQHQVASQSILDWYQTDCATLFSEKTPLWQLEDQGIETAAEAYGSLKDRIGARRSRYGNDSKVPIGATAASKILFAIRPEAMMPWDEAMRKSFSCDGSPLSYTGYLKTIRALTVHIDTLCRQKGFQIENLPGKIGRPSLTVVELVNEYVWVTETLRRRKVNLPSSQTLMQWASLG